MYKINMINELNDIIIEKSFNVNDYLIDNYENTILTIDKYILDKLNNKYDKCDKKTNAKNIFKKN